MFYRIFSSGVQQPVRFTVEKCILELLTINILYFELNLKEDMIFNHGDEENFIEKVQYHRDCKK